MTWLRMEGGSASLMVIAALPLLSIILVAVLEVGALRMLAARARAAADLAAIVAVNDQDDAELARSGRLVLARDAVAVARAYLATNLGSLGSTLADDADTVAAGADIVAFADAPAIDPRTGERYDRPTVRIAATIPLRTPVLGALIGRPTTPVFVRATSSAR